MAINVLQHTYKSHQLIQLANEAATFLNTTPLHPLPIDARFSGCGVYALYYNGSHPQYAGKLGANKPIYVGKAVPSGWRTGATSNESEIKLKNRLNEHSRSIEQTSNLNIGDFKCRFMIIPLDISVLISVVESLLIRQYQPVWNTSIDGFGNHDPGKGRYQQAKSEWDKLHPGRTWATRLTG